MTKDKKDKKDRESTSAAAPAHSAEFDSIKPEKTAPKIDTSK